MDMMGGGSLAFQFIADKLLQINENGNLVNPPPVDPKLCAEQDDEIFHRTRLVNCGFFMQIILGDYVAAILGLVRDGITWRLDPRIVRFYLSQCMMT
jgi:linoleate 10R-lipoxygenase